MVHSDTELIQTLTGAVVISFTTIIDSDAKHSVNIIYISSDDIKA